MGCRAPATGSALQRPPPSPPSSIGANAVGQASETPCLRSSRVTADRVSLPEWTDERYRHRGGSSHREDRKGLSQRRRGGAGACAGSICRCSRARWWSCWARPGPENPPLLNILGGLDTPTSGRVFFPRPRLTRLSDAALTAFRRDHVGFVFQFYNLVPSLTAREKRGDGHRNRVASDAPRRGARTGRTVGPHGPFPRRAVGGRTTACGHRRGRSPSGPKSCSGDEPPRRAGQQDRRDRSSMRLWRFHRDLGRRPALITHNAGIRKLAHRVNCLADGRIVREERNAARLAPSEVTW